MITSAAPVERPSEQTLPAAPSPSLRGQARARTTGRLVVLGPIAASVGFYTIFIARTALHFDGRTFFSLFDDAMISMRYAENLAHGHGLVYNAGAPAVEGYTNFLWTLYMAMVHLLPISDSSTSLVIEITGVVLVVGSGLVAAALARLLAPESRLVVLLAVTSTVFFYPLVFWTLRGMETGLATLLVCALVLQTLRLQQSFSTRRLIAIAGLGALAVLVRDDLVLPVSVVLIYAIGCVGRERRRRTAVILLGSVAGTIGGHEAFRLAYYGNALPNTYYLKLQGASLPTRLTRGAYAVASTYTLTLFAPLALAAAAIVRPLRNVDRRLLLLAAVVSSTFLYDLYVGGDAWEELRFADRFLTTGAPLLFALAAVGVHRLTQDASAALTKRRAAVALGLLVVAVPLALLPSAKVLYWLSDGQWTGGASAILRRIAPPLLAAAALIALLMVRRRFSSQRSVLMSAAALAAGVLLLAVLPNMRAYSQWRSSSSQDLAGVEYAAQLGLALRTVTKPGDSIAVAAAGALPYFSQRNAVDLLGVNDSHIAHEQPETARFLPGHTKWDYPYSIGKYRPTIVYALYEDPGGVGLRTLLRYGYVLAAVDFSPAETAFDHLPSGRTVWVSPVMAARIRRRDAVETPSPQPPVRLDLIPTSGAG